MNFHDAVQKQAARHPSFYVDNTMMVKTEWFLELIFGLKRPMKLVSFKPPVRPVDKNVSSIFVPSAVHKALVALKHRF